MATCKRSPEINCPTPIVDNAIPAASPKFLSHNGLMFTILAILKGNKNPPP